MNEAERPYYTPIAVGNGVKNGLTMPRYSNGVMKNCALIPNDTRDAFFNFDSRTNHCQAGPVENCSCNCTSVGVGENSMDQKDSYPTHDFYKPACYSPPLSPYLTDNVEYSKLHGHQCGEIDAGIASVHFANVYPQHIYAQTTAKAVGSERRRKISQENNLQNLRSTEGSPQAVYSNGFSTSSKEFCAKEDEPETDNLVRNLFLVKSTYSYEEILKSISNVAQRKDVDQAILRLQDNGVLSLVSKSPPAWRINSNSKTVDLPSYLNGVHLGSTDRQQSRRHFSFSEAKSESRDPTDFSFGFRRKTSCNAQSSQRRSSDTSMRSSQSAPSQGCYFDGQPSQLDQNSRYIRYTEEKPGRFIGRTTAGRRSSRSSVTEELLFEDEEDERGFDLDKNRHGKLTPLEDNIREVLAQHNRPLTSFEIAKDIGVTMKRDVSPSLYAMERTGMINRVKTQPPVWALSFRQNPGVIGGERSKAHSRSQSLNESMLGLYHISTNSKDKQTETILKPRSRSFNSCDGDTNVNACSLCKVTFSSKQQADEHLQSTKHQNRFAKVTADPYLKFCEYCKVHLNSKSQAQEHFKSARHEQTVAKSQKAPVRSHTPLKTKLKPFNPMAHTKTSPSSYQVELYSKAMATNSVCFLPTGTGKTLVSALVIANILQYSPSRQVVFLVDRVLLVLQQSDYLRNELQNVLIPTSSKDGDQSIGKLTASRLGRSDLRPVRVGAICGEMRKLESGVPIFDHDVLVVTADCYRNHINNGTLRFEDLALIVLDEAHHCNKEHPYNVIIRDYYLRDRGRMLQTPKVLGLISSPAGEPTSEKTIKKIQRLLSNLGGASFLTVTEENQELNEKTRLGELKCYPAEYSQYENELQRILTEYATKCFNLAARLSELKDYKDIFQPSAGGLLAMDDIYPLLEITDNILLYCKHDGNPHKALLHFQIMCECICSLQECGVVIAFDQIVGLNDTGCPYGFDWAEGQGLPCRNVKSLLQDFPQGSSTLTLHGVPGTDSGLRELINLLLKFGWEKSHIPPTPIALVVVKRGRTAISLTNSLMVCVELQRLGVMTSCIVDHGGALATGMGMSNAIERETATQGLFHVVVATTLAEEGLDLPGCKLVVHLDPPSSVAAVNQIRGHVRQKEASFAVISRDEAQGRKLKDLLLREENMRQAAKVISSHRFTGKVLHL